MSSTRINVRVNAPRAQVYRALLDAQSVATWMVPDGMTSQVHEFDPREGGGFRISLTYEEPTGTGKTTSHTDTFHGRFVKLVEPEQVVEVVEFETADPAMRGEMTIRFSLTDANGGTDLSAVHEGLPPGLSPADNELGWRSSLGKLARLVASTPALPEHDHTLQVSALECSLQDIRLWRDRYRLELSCQIIHDSIHGRAGWTREYRLALAGATVGYGSVAVAGPWAGNPTLYEFYVVPTQRSRMFDLFQALLERSGAESMEVQSNDALATVMLHTFASQVTSESILFHDQLQTSHQLPGVTLRMPTASEAPDVPAEHLPWRRVIEVDGQIAANGGILFHYNRPYGDIYMDVAEPFRRRGFGTFLVQELKRVCYEGGHIPAARCSTTNVASRRTLQKAGFVPCGHILTGSLRI